jgi:hypothetical protein
VSTRVARDLLLALLERCWKCAIASMRVVDRVALNLRIAAPRQWEGRDDAAGDTS